MSNRRRDYEVSNKETVTSAGTTSGLSVVDWDVCACDLGAAGGCLLTSTGRQAIPSCDFGRASELKMRLAPDSRSSDSGWEMVSE